MIVPTLWRKEERKRKGMAQAVHPVKSADFVPFLFRVLSFKPLDIKRYL